MDIQRKQERRPARDKKRCSACGAVATSAHWVEVSWMRGDDEGPVYACREHKNAPALLAGWLPPALAARSQEGA